MSESDGKTAEYVHAYVMGLRSAKEATRPEIIEPWHGKATGSEWQF